MWKCPSTKCLKNVFFSKRTRFLPERKSSVRILFTLFVARPLLYITAVLKCIYSVLFLRKSLANVRLHKTTKVSVKMFSTERSRERNWHRRLSHLARCTIECSTICDTQTSLILTFSLKKQFFHSRYWSKQQICCTANGYNSVRCRSATLKLSTVVKHTSGSLLVKEFRESTDRPKSYSWNKLENQLYRKVAIHSYTWNALNNY
jgi:hypothetical protein